MVTWLQFQEHGTRSSETVMMRARGGLLATAVAVAAASSTPVLPCHAWVLAGDLDPATAKTVAGVAGPAWRG